MAQLKEGAIEVDGFMLGADPSAAVFVESFDPGFASTRSEDTENPVGDSMAFGRDYLTPPVMTLGLVVNKYSAADAAQTLGALAKVWRADKVRATPGAESVLRYALAGRTRRVYGRTRKLAYTPAGIATGAVPVTAEFATSDTLYYDDAERSETLRIIPPSTGGFVAPFTSPIITTTSAEAQGTIEDVGGDVATPFLVTFQGPIANPKLEGNGWQMELRTTIAYDRSVTIDTRRKTVMRSDGANLSGLLTHKSNLGTARLKPGPDYLKFSGTDATGTATCRVRWRPAYAGL